MKVHFIHTAIATSLAVASCNQDDEAVRPKSPPGGLNEPRVEVPAGSVVSGFKHGTLRRDIAVKAFSISKQPITWAQYRACLAAEACKTPAAACANLDGGEQDAALCVGQENARAYCAWSGGRLPSLSE